MPALARLGGATLVGVFVAVTLVLSNFDYAAPQTGWDAAVLTYLGLTVPAIWRLDPQATAEKALREDPTRPLADLLLLGAAVASLAALAVVLVRVHNSTGATQLILTILAVVSVVLSWALVHVTYTLRYARVYYTSPVGGIDFNQEESP